jgi:Asp-tRNA(Asn)/Glu-tRNA(Gln) amidotransferase B subunit
MTQEQKLLAVVGILPAIADLIEDVKLYQLSKKYANMFIDEVRKTDTTVIKDAELEAQSQQVNIQRAFRQWLNTEFVAE